MTYDVSGKFINTGPKMMYKLISVVIAPSNLSEASMELRKYFETTKPDFSPKDGAQEKLLKAFLSLNEKTVTKETISQTVSTFLVSEFSGSKAIPKTVSELRTQTTYTSNQTADRLSTVMSMLKKQEKVSDSFKDAMTAWAKETLNTWPGRKALKPIEDAALKKALGKWVSLGRSEVAGLTKKDKMDWEACKLSFFDPTTFLEADGNKTEPYYNLLNLVTTLPKCQHKSYLNFLQRQVTPKKIVGDMARSRAQGNVDLCKAVLEGVSKKQSKLSKLFSGKPETIKKAIMNAIKTGKFGKSHEMSMRTIFLYIRSCPPSEYRTKLEVFKKVVADLKPKETPSRMRGALAPLENNKGKVEDVYVKKELALDEFVPFRPKRMGITRRSNRSSIYGIKDKELVVTQSENGEKMTSKKGRYSGVKPARYRDDDESKPERLVMKKVAKRQSGWTDTMTRAYREAALLELQGLEDVSVGRSYGSEGVKTFIIQPRVIGKTACDIEEYLFDRSYGEAKLSIYLGYAVPLLREQFVAVEKLQSSGLVHGDANAYNRILRVENGLLKLQYIDFGQGYSIAGVKSRQETIPNYKQSEQNKAWCPDSHEFQRLKKEHAIDWMLLKDQIVSMKNNITKLAEEWKTTLNQSYEERVGKSVTTSLASIERLQSCLDPTDPQGSKRAYMRELATLKSISLRS